MEKMRTAAIAVVAAIVGGAVVWVLQGHTFQVVPGSMSYSDLVAIILSAISALMAIFGIGLAVITIWGISQFRRGVEAKIVEITPGFLVEEMKTGGSRQVLDNLVVEFFRAEMAKSGMAAAWVAERQRQNAQFDDVDAEPEE
jgi:hypothetical protein